MIAFGLQPSFQWKCQNSHVSDLVQLAAGPWFVAVLAISSWLCAWNHQLSAIIWADCYCDEKTWSLNEKKAINMSGKKTRRKKIPNHSECSDLSSFSIKILTGFLCVWPLFHCCIRESIEPLIHASFFFYPSHIQLEIVILTAWLQFGYLAKCQVSATWNSQGLVTPQP